MVTHSLYNIEFVLRGLLLLHISLQVNDYRVMLDSDYTRNPDGRVELSCCHLCSIKLCLGILSLLSWA